MLDLVIKFKSVILNRNTNSNTNSAKENVWKRITKLFNKEGIHVHRSTDHLKTKWLNLKREAKRLQINSPSDMNDLHKQVIQLSCESISDPTLQVEITELDLNDGNYAFLNSCTDVYFIYFLWSVRSTQNHNVV